MLRPGEITLVNQIDDSSCHHATCAMVTGTSINELIAEYGNDDGLAERDAIRILMRHMILPVPIHTFMQGSYPLWNPGLYMVTTPSLNDSGRLHSVVVVSTVVCGLSVLDPQNGRSGMKWWPRDSLTVGSAGPALQYLEILKLEDMAKG